MFNAQCVLILDSPELIGAALAALVLTAGSSTPADAWGFTAHKFIMDRAITLLPPEIRPFFEQYRTTVVEHAIDPDTYRTMGFVEEPPRHFLDMDAYGPPPFTALPHDYDAAVAKFGKDVVLKNGVLPWRTHEIADRLRDAFKQTTPFARDDIKLFSAVITHYIGDAFQPFHAALNYDGQLTGQQGVHSRFEAELFERYQDRLHVTPEPITTVENVRDFTFAALTDSFRQVDDAAGGGPRRGSWPDGLRRRVLCEVFRAARSRFWSGGSEARSPARRPSSPAPGFKPESRRCRPRRRHDRRDRFDRCRERRRSAISGQLSAVSCQRHLASVLGPRPPAAAGARRLVRRAAGSAGPQASRSPPIIAR